MSAPTDLAADLALALELAALADDTARAELATGVRTETKPDGTPVTNVDLAVDRVLVDALRIARPDDAVLSEESGVHGDGARGWILDPIDGTFNLVRGHRHWGTHVALEVDGAIAVGVITRPMLDARWWATRGGGAYRTRRGGSAGTTGGVDAGGAGECAQIRLWNDDVDHATRLRARRSGPTPT